MLKVFILDFTPSSVIGSISGSGAGTVCVGIARSIGFGEGAWFTTVPNNELYAQPLLLSSVLIGRVGHKSAFYVFMSNEEQGMMDLVWQINLMTNLEMPKRRRRKVDQQCTQIETNTLIKTLTLLCYGCDDLNQHLRPKLLNNVPLNLSTLWNNDVSVGES